MSFLLNSESIIICPHGGRVQTKPVYGTDYLVDGQPVCVKEDAYSIFGCPMRKNQCQSIKWNNDPSGFRLLGKYLVLTNTSIGICVDRNNSATGMAISLQYQTTTSLDTFRESFKSV